METGKWGSWHSLPSSTPQEPFPKGLALFRPLLCPQHTGRTEAWKVLSPQGSPWDSVARVLPNGSLLLPAVGIPDEGIFRCRAMSRKGKEIKSNYQVRVYRKGSGLPQGPPLLSGRAFNPSPCSLAGPGGGRTFKAPAFDRNSPSFRDPREARDC